MRSKAIIKYAMLSFGVTLSFIWGMLCFRFISLPTFVFFLLIFITMPRHKNRKILYTALGLYLFSTVIPIDVRTPSIQYQTPMPSVKIIPLIMGYPLDYNVQRLRNGEIYLGRDVTTGLEPKWVLLWQTNLISLTMNNYIDFFIEIGYIKIQ